MSIEGLVATVTPPVHPMDLQWTEVEALTTMSVSSDIKAVVRLYGAGQFDGFIWLLAPGCENQNLDLREQTLRQRQALEELNEMQTLTFLNDLEIQISDLMAFAITDNGDVCYWARSAVEGDVVLVNEGREPSWYMHPGSASDFLADVLSGRSKCYIFPDDFPSQSIEFTRFSATS